MPTLILIRGTSGAGKSTLARQMAAELGCEVFENDDFFTSEDGTYRFDQSLHHLAWEHCKLRTRQALEGGRDAIVANTFTKVKDLRPYMALAEELGATVRIITLTSSHRNVHGVPDSVVDGMLRRILNCPLPQEWLVYEERR